METLTCIALARELDSLLADTYIAGAEQADAGKTLLLQLRGTPGAHPTPSSGWIAISACGGEPVIFFEKSKPKTEGRTWPVPLSSQVERMFVLSISHNGMDRTIDISLSSSPKADMRPGPEPGGGLYLRIELFALRPGVYLFEPGTLRLIESFGGRRSDQSSGGADTSKYSPPAQPGGKIDPMALAAKSIDAGLPPNPKEGDLVDRLLGVGPVLASEILARTCGRSPSPGEVLKSLLEEALAGNPGGYVMRPRSSALAAGVPKALTFRPAAQDDMEVMEFATVNEAVRESYSSCRRLTLELERRRLSSKEIRARLTRLARTQRSLAKELADSERADDLRRIGEVILAHIGAVPKGAEEVKLPDPMYVDRKLSVALKPRLTPAENAALYFKRARKLQKKRSFLPERIEHLSKEEDRLRGDLERVLGGGPLKESKVHSKSGSPRGPRKDKWPTGISPRRFVSSDGWKIYVGRNNKENDYVTFVFAKPDDLWFHAHGVAGSHVVLRREGRKAQPSKRCIEETASVAAHFSKARTSQTVAVIYTEKRYVRKPRKGAAGTALYTHEKTVMVSPELPAADYS